MNNAAINIGVRVSFLICVFGYIPRSELPGPAAVLFLVLCEWVQPFLKTVRPDSGTQVSRVLARCSRLKPGASPQDQSLERREPLLTLTGGMSLAGSEGLGRPGAHQRPTAAP